MLGKSAATGDPECGSCGKYPAHAGGYHAATVSGACGQNTVGTNFKRTNSQFVFIRVHRLPGEATKGEDGWFNIL